MSQENRIEYLIQETKFESLKQKSLSWAEVLDFPDHITPMDIHGLCIIHRPKFTDERGSMQMLWTMSDIKLIAQREITFRQQNHSRSLPKGKPIMRGIHAENQWKLIRPLKGNMLGVFIDLRPHSTTFLKKDFIRFERKDMVEPGIVLLIPPGVANSIYAYKKPGETDDEAALEYFYSVSEEYDPKSAALGIRFDDSELAIPWDDPNPLISDRDKNLPNPQQFLDQFAHKYGY